MATPSYMNLDSKAKNTSISWYTAMGIIVTFGTFAASFIMFVIGMEYFNTSVLLDSSGLALEGASSAGGVIVDAEGNIIDGAYTKTEQTFWGKVLEYGGIVAFVLAPILMIATYITSKLTDKVKDNNDSFGITEEYRRSPTGNNYLLSSGVENRPLADINTSKTAHNNKNNKIKNH